MHLRRITHKVLQRRLFLHENLDILIFQALNQTIKANDNLNIQDFSKKVFDLLFSLILVAIFPEHHGLDRIIAGLHSWHTPAGRTEVLLVLFALTVFHTRKSMPVF